MPTEVSGERVEQKINLGSPFLHFFVRTLQLFWTLCAALVVVGVLPADAFTRTVAGAALILLTVQFHWWAYGYADESGITFQRYFERHFVPWDEIRKADWGGWYALNLVIVTLRPVEWSKRVYFPYPTWSVVKLLGALSQSWVPDEVAWVLDHVEARK